MKRENEVDKVFNNLIPLVEGLSSNELFTLASFCVVMLVRRNIGNKNFNDMHKGEIFNEIKSLCSALEKSIKPTFTLTIN